MLGSAERRKVRLISREIIFNNSDLNVTDGRTDDFAWQYSATLSFAR